MGARPNSQFCIQFSLVFNAFVLCFFFSFLIFVHWLPYPISPRPKPPPGPGDWGPPLPHPWGPQRVAHGAQELTFLGPPMAAPILPPIFPPIFFATNSQRKRGKKNWCENWRVAWRHALAQKLAATFLVCGGFLAAFSACFYCRLGGLLSTPFRKFIWL